MTYENDRDRKARLIREFWEVKEKACKRCGVVQPNAYTHFGKKRFLDLENFCTVDVCNSCVTAKHRARWIKIKWDEYDYQCFKAMEYVRKQRIERGVKGDAPRAEWSEIDERVYTSLAPSTPPEGPRPE